MHRRHVLAALAPVTMSTPVRPMGEGQSAQHEATPVTACTHVPPAPPQQAREFLLPGRDRPLRAWVARPAGATAWWPRRWPLVVFLHGSGERGDDLARVKVHGPPRLVDEGRAYPFILVSPQLEAGRTWDAHDLHALLQVLRREERIDPRRVYATGLSLGGKGVWDWASTHPQDLAAIAPVCGWGEPQAVCAARGVPVRAYHGDADTVVTLVRQQAVVDALRACGGQVDFIVYPGVGHDAWTPAYADPELMPWLLRQVKT